MKQHTCQQIQVKAKRAPLHLQHLADGIIQVHADQEEKQPCGRWVNDKGHDSPDLAVQDGGGIERQVSGIEIGSTTLITYPSA